MISKLEQFAFDQARFVYATSRTCERELMCNDKPVHETFKAIKQTELGSKFLAVVSIREVENEIKNPGDFMNANTVLGCYIPEDTPEYVEDWKNN